MNYYSQLLTLACWPILIYVSYRLAFWAIEKFEEPKQGKASE